MGKFLKNFATRFLAVAAVVALIISSVNAPARADEGDYSDDDPCANGHQATVDEAGSRDPSCTNEGYTHYVCIRCGADLGTDVILAYGHERDGGETHDATCTQDGYIIYRCERCGMEMGSNTIPAKGHESDAGTVVKQPTTSQPGKIEYRCVRCGAVIREEQIPLIGKRDLPQAVFKTDSCRLTNIPENSTVTLNGAVISNNASGELSLNNLFPQTGDYTISVVANDNGKKGASDPQTIRTHKPNMPSHIQTVDEPADGGMGAIGGVDTSMEYSYADQDTWFVCTSSSQPVKAGIYIVRYRATSTSIASESMEAVVAKGRKKKPATPTASFDGASHQLRNLSAGMAYSTNGGDTWTKVSDSAVKLSSDAVNQAVSYKSIKVKNIVQGVESDVQSVTVGRVAQPNGVSTTPATSGNNGTMKGVGSDMQYMKDGGNAWIDIGSDKVTGLSKGKYYVRRKATGYMVESNPVTVIVDDKGSSSKEGTPTATFNAYNMHIDGVSGCRLSFDGGKTWTNRINESSYVINESYLNTTNGIILYRQGNGTTTADSDRQYIVLIKQPTPSGITATSATATVPGSIVGTDVSMQYRASNQSTWIDITGNMVPVAAGTYYLRRHGYANALPSDWLTIVIKASTNVEPVAPKDVVPVDNTTPKKESSLDTDTEAKTEEKKDTQTDNKDEAADIEITDDAEPVSTSGEVGWEAIEATFEKAEDPVVIKLNAATLVPSDVFVKAAETNTPIVLAAKSDAVWSILPSDVNVDEVNALKGVNLGIIDDSVNIPAETLSTVEDTANYQLVNRTFDIKHEGNFGFKANLTMKLRDVAPGEYATLYTYNPYKGELEYIDSSIINFDKEATFKMTHASSYVVVTSPSAMAQALAEDAKVQQLTQNTESSDSAAITSNTGADKKPVKKASPVVISLIIIIIALIIALAVVLIYQNKSNAKAHKRK